MKDHADWRELIVAAAGAIALSVLVVGGGLTVPRLRAQAPTGQTSATPTPAAQPPTPQWEIDAGGKMDFDVASVKVSIDSETPHANIPLDSGDSQPSNVGLLTITKFRLSGLIAFAYKLTAYQMGSLGDRLPKALAAERFDIEARAPGNPTKDQMRLMMRSLLTDRFKLSAHVETRQMPIYDLVLDKPGKPGPQLTRGSSGPCVETAPEDGWFQPCRAIGLLIVSGRWHVGARNLSTPQIANYLDTVAPGGTLGRAVFDQTGLNGLYDLRLEFTPEASALPDGMQPDPDGPPFVEALKDQLGLKLESQTGPVDVLVIDHVEEPSAN